MRCGLNTGMPTGAGRTLPGPWHVRKPAAVHVARKLFHPQTMKNKTPPTVPTVPPQPMADRPPLRHPAADLPFKLPGSLLSIEADAKTAKGSASGHLTGILYLAPGTLAGVGNLCPHASPGCLAACLFTAGFAGV